MYDEEVQTLQPEDWDGGEFFVHNDTLYYMADGVWSMPVEGGEAKQMDGSCILTDMNFFAYDGILGTSGSGEAIYLDPEEGALFWNDM